MRTTTRPLPNDFNYDRKTGDLIVTFTDGSKVKYYDIDPKSLFLSNGNSHAAADFFAFVDTVKPVSELVNGPTRATGVTSPEPIMKPVESPWNKIDK